MTRGTFSVIIPTLQRSPELRPLVDVLVEHPQVHEVLVVNNARTPIRWGSSKVRVLQQEANIYVNPAWNLGVREAVGEYAAIVNDDVELHPYLLDIAYGLLRRPRLAGLVGVHPSCFMEAPQNTWVRPTFVRGFAFGTAMFLRRRDYVPIPEDMKVWCGNDWIFANRPAPAWVVGGLRRRTDMSTTSGSPEFQALLRQDAERWDRHQRSMRTPVSSAVGRALVAGVEAGARRLHLLNP